MFLDKWDNILTTQLKLEFYQKRRRQWPMPVDDVPWEVWDLNLEVVKIDSAGMLNLWAGLKKFQFMNKTFAI